MKAVTVIFSNPKYNYTIKIVPELTNKQIIQQFVGKMLDVSNGMEVKLRQCVNVKIQRYAQI